jgi:cellulose synthase/poly-beta-1,6-N-acetylglucosamine synthase-like glycosyltransferase
VEGRLAKPEVTVLFATRNGAHVLPRVLMAYRAAATVATNWKLVVVDNGSTDATAEILDAFRRELPLEILQHRPPGKNRALNAAIGAMEGELVVLTDDDAPPSPSFLLAWLTKARALPDYDLFGGTIGPVFESPAPRWLTRSQRALAMLFSERRLPEGETTWDQIYGPNMAVRKRILDSGFRFDERVGPDASNAKYPMGSESEFCRRVASAGVKCWFAAEPTVSHIVRAYQLMPAYWAARAHRSGRGRAFLLATDSSGVPVLPSHNLPAGAGKTEAVRDWLKTMSPLALQRFEGLCAKEFRQGFREEWALRQQPAARAA